MLAVLMAAANFEWTVGRCILFFGFEPNVNLREKLSRCHGLEKYKNLWKEELTRKDPTIPPLTKIVENWAEFTDAFNLRHILIHGRGTCSRNMAEKPVSKKCFWQLMPCMILRGLVEKTLMTAFLFAGKSELAKTNRPALLRNGLS